MDPKRSEAVKRSIRDPHSRACAALALCALAILGCKGETEPPAPTKMLDRDTLMHPDACQKCHPNQFAEWAGSMHAYASDDPVFRAMNARGQRETNKQLGKFCVNCHAPMAVREGATEDGLNLDQVPAQLKGVTCYFCHSVDKVTGTHDAALTLADDGVMRGGFSNPVTNTAHQAAYSPLVDRYAPDSATLCGSCHDIVNGHGAHLERTFAEWQGTLFSKPGTGTLACGSCHMKGKQGLAADAPGVVLREVHSHRMPGVDVALTQFPDMEAQHEGVQAILDSALGSVLCVKGANLPGGGATIQVVLDNIGGGHSFPSGASQDRRAWIEVVAYDDQNAVIYESGQIADNADILDPKHQDPDLWLIRDCMFDDKNKQVTTFWDASSIDTNLLPGAITLNPADPNFYTTHVVRTFPQKTSTPSSLNKPPAKVTMRVRMMPVGLDVLEELVASKDLDPSIASAMKPFSLGNSNLTWTDATAPIKYGDNGVPVSCVFAAVMAGANTATPAPEHKQCKP
jgi:hypothetical protein